MARDWLPEFRRVTERLAAGGFTAERAALVEAVEASSTGTEIALRLRYHLRQLAVDERMSIALREMASALAEHLDATIAE